MENGQTENQLITDRKNKLKQWQDLDFGYAEKFARTHTSQEARDFLEKNSPRETKEVMEQPVAKIKMCGRLIGKREMGKLAFLKIRDEAGDFQICFAKQILDENFKTWCKLLDLGDFVGFAGEFFTTNHGEATLLATEVFPLSKSLRPLPEKWHGLSDREQCYRERNIDLATNTETFERFKIRAKIVQKIRDFFTAKNFQEVETRTLQPQAGGAMAETFTTHHNALDTEFTLRISLELDLKMAVSGGMERIFEIGKCFRNEGIDPSHLQEFTLLEWYAAYQDLSTNQLWTEELLQIIVKEIIKKDEIPVLDKDGKTHQINFAGKFASIKFADLLKNHADLDIFSASDDEVRAVAKKFSVEKIDKLSRANLLDNIYKKTARPQIIQPTFVTDYPQDLKPLARPNGDGTANCFQLLIAGWELVNSYGELIDPLVQRKLLEQQAMAKQQGDDETMDLDEDFLRAMEHGFPPMTGSGIGIDRLCALLTSQPNLRDVVLFPTMRKL